MTHTVRGQHARMARLARLWHCIAWMLICGSLCATSGVARAMSAVRLAEGISDVVLDGKVEALVDHGAALTLADVRSQANAARFSVSTNGRIDAQASEAVWLRIALHNSARQTRPWWLDTGAFEVRSMDLYAPDSAGVYQRQSASSMLPFGTRPLPLKTIAFPLQLQPSIDSIVYIRATVVWRGLIVKPRIWAPSALQDTLRTERNNWLAYVGAAGALILFNFLLAIALRDRHYALYALASLALLWSVSSWQGGYGNAYEMLWPDSPGFERFGHDSAGMAAIVIGAIFLASLLSLRKQTPRLFRLLAGTTTLYLSCWALLHTVAHFSPIPGPASMSLSMVVGPAYNLAAFLTMLLLSIAIARLAWQGSRPARLMALAVLPVVLAGVASNLMAALGNPLPNAVMIWVTLFEMLMMALALADRFQQDRKDKLQAQIGLVAGLQASERAMEGQVILRTRELSEALTLQQIAVARNHDLVDLLTAQKDVAEAAVLAKSRFLAAASHDLRQPTHALALFIATLQSMGQRPEVKGAEVSHIAERLQTTLGGLGRLLNGLLDVSRLDAGAIEVRKGPVSLRGELSALHSAFSGPANAKGLDFRVRLPAALAVDTDAVLLHQILWNLAANAVRYTERGRVLIGCRRRAGMVEIQVWDSGIGIAPDQQEQIFEEFYQVDNVARHHELGLGLGLAIVRRSAQLVGTRLELASVPGKGSMFSFSLPRVVAACTSPHQEQASPRSGSRRGATVLVIDDDAQVRDAVTMLLSDWGHTVIAAGTVEQAVNAARALEQAQAADGRRQGIDLILSDYRLAENVTGADAVRAVLSHIGRPVTAVIITGDTSPERIREARASGFRLLHKPLDPLVLHALLNEYDD